MIESEKNAAVDALNDRIDALNALTKAEREAKREQEDALKLAELQAAVDRAKNDKFRTEAQKKLDAELARQAEAARERERAAEIDAMKAEIKDLEEGYKAQKTLEDQRMEALEESHKQQTELMRQQYDAQRQAAEQHYKQLLNAEHLNAEARRLLLAESNDEMIALLEAYNPEWYNAGKSFGELFVEALDVQMENVRTIMEQASAFAQGKLDGIKAQIAAMNSAAANAGSGSGTGSVTDSLLSSMAQPYRPMLDGASTSLGTAQMQTKTTAQTLNVIINQPVQSPAEVAYAVKQASKELAYGI